MVAPILSQARLKELLHYNPETGVFTWIKSASRCIRAGAVMGSRAKTGYLTGRVDYKLYLNHRLAFLYMTGEFPRDQVDHINGVRTDNRWKNLRAVTKAENTRNRRISKNNKSGVHGVYPDKRNGRWYAQIMVDDKTITLGYFGTFDEAVAVRKAAEKKHGFHANHGRAI